MMLIEIVDVLTGDDIDIGIPLTIECIELFKLLQLCVGEGGEVFLYRSVLKRRIQYLTYFAIGNDELDGTYGIRRYLIGVIDECDGLVVENEVF